MEILSALSHVMTETKQIPEDACQIAEV